MNNALVPVATGAIPLRVHVLVKNQTGDAESAWSGVCDAASSLSELFFWVVLCP